MRVGYKETLHIVSGLEQKCQFWCTLQKWTNFVGGGGWGEGVYRDGDTVPIDPMLTISSYPYYMGTPTWSFHPPVPEGQTWWT